MICFRQECDPCGLVQVSDGVQTLCCCVVDNLKCVITKRSDKQPLALDIRSKVIESALTPANGIVFVSLSLSAACAWTTDRLNQEAKKITSTFMELNVICCHS